MTDTGHWPLAEFHERRGRDWVDVKSDMMSEPHRFVRHTRPLGSELDEIRHLYLELLKRALTRYELEDIERRPVLGRSRIRRSLIRPVQRALRMLGLEVVTVRAVRHDLRRVGRDHPQNADTMVGMVRLNNIQECIEDILNHNVPGDLIEAGVWRGGAAIFMRGVLKTYGIVDRRVWLADSFRGLPPPNREVNPADDGDRHFQNKYLAVPRSDVERRFLLYNLLDDQVCFLEGWFAETLPTLADRSFALVRLDGDMYGSTMEALQNLYPSLAVGGSLIVDDYHLAGCRAAVDDYRQAHGIREELLPVDDWAVYWRKRLPNP